MNEGVTQAGGLPDFLILGAPRSGTTSLYQYLNSHPQIFMSPVKEPAFFAFRDQKPRFEGPDDNSPRAMGSWMVTDIETYRGLFADAAPGQRKGEASPNYLYSASAPDNIKELIPNAKLIAILRNPVDRAYSHYVLHRQSRREPCTSFAEALALEKEREAANWEWSWSYIAVGRYYEQLLRYYERFPAGQIHVFLFEDLEKDTPGVVRQVFEILGVDADFLPPNIETRYMTAAIPRNAQIDSFLRRKNPWRSAIRALIPAPIARAAWRFADRRNHYREALHPDLRRRLLDDSKDEIEKLSGLIGRDLSHWLA